MLSDKQVTKFQMLYLKHFNKKISREEAYDKAIKLVNLMKIICSSNNRNENNY